jgi:hypothetical protein
MIDSVCLEEMDIQSKLLETLGGMEYLRSLFIADSQLPDEGFRYLQQHSRLREVGFSDTDVGRNHLKHISKCPIQFLTLKNEELFADDITAMHQLPKIESILLYNITFNDSEKELGELLKQSHQLESITAVETNLTGEFLSYLPDNLCLRELILDGSPITDEAITNITRFPFLQSLFLIETEVTEASRDTILFHPNLHYFAGNPENMEASTLEEIENTLEARRPKYFKNLPTPDSDRIERIIEDLLKKHSLDK